MGILSAREALFQRLVFQTRNALDVYSKKGKLSQQLLSELKILIENADKLGVHGAASLKIS